MFNLWLRNLVISKENIYFVLKKGTILIQFCQIYVMENGKDVHVDNELTTYPPHVDKNGHWAKHLPIPFCPRSFFE